jgi:hypothetical protein
MPDYLADAILGALGISDAEASWLPWAFARARGSSELVRGGRGASGFSQLRPVRDTQGLEEIRAQHGVVIDPHGMPHIWIEDDPPFELAESLRGGWTGEVPLAEALAGTSSKHSFSEAAKAHSPDLRIMLRDMGPTTRGSYSPLDNLITLSSSSPKEEWASSLLHETSHALDWLSGGAPGAFVRDSDDILEQLSLMETHRPLTTQNLHRTAKLMPKFDVISTINEASPVAFAAAKSLANNLGAHALYKRTGGEALARLNQAAERPTFLPRHLTGEYPAPWRQLGNYPFEIDLGLQYLATPAWEPGRRLQGILGGLGR